MSNHIPDTSNIVRNDTHDKTLWDENGKPTDKLKTIWAQRWKIRKSALVMPMTDTMRERIMNDSKCWNNA